MYLSLKYSYLPTILLCIDISNSRWSGFAFLQEILKDLIDQESIVSFWKVWDCHVPKCCYSSKNEHVVNILKCRIRTYLAFFPWREHKNLVNVCKLEIFKWMANRL